MKKISLRPLKRKGIGWEKFWVDSMEEICDYKTLAEILLMKSNIVSVRLNHKYQTFLMSSVQGKRSLISH